MDLLNDLLDKALECPVCLEQLDASARVLPCQHTFCRRCLLEIVHSRRELLCPECRVQCDQPVEDLPSNILLIRLLEGIKTNRKQSSDRNNGQNVNDLLEFSSQTSVVGPQSTTVGLSINQLFCSKQILSQSTPHSQPNQSQSPQIPQSQALPQPPQQISLKHPLPAPPQQQQTNQIHTQSQQQQLLTQQQQQSLVKQLIQTPNSLPGAKSLYNYDGKDLEDYVALYNYKPQKVDELELKKGELYSVYKKCHDGWYKGVSVRSGTSGVFPGNYVQLVKSCVQIAQYGCPVGSGTSQSRLIGQPLPQTRSMVTEPPLPKPKPILPLKPSISLSSGVTPIELSCVQTTSPQSNSATDNAIVYARPRPTGQPLYDVSRNISSLVPPPPPPQRPTRPLSSILVPNTKLNDESSSAANQLAQTLNQSLLISKPQSVSQSSLNERTSPVWHQPKVAATRNTISMANSSSMHSTVTAITPPPNVSVMSSSSLMTPTGHTGHRPPIDRKESKSKEKSNFIKRFTSSSKPKRKQNSNNNNNNNSNNHNNSHNNVSNNSFSCDNPTFVDTSPNSLAPIHIRSGSCPNESLTDVSSHKKQSSFDDSNTVIKNRMASKTTVKESPQTEQPSMAPPLVRERYRCVVPYPPNSEYELELKVGDIVYVHKKREDGWFKGTLQRTGKTGLFPGPFVESF